VQISHGGSQGFKSPHLHPQHCRSERRRATIGGALVVPGAAWGHTGATAGLPAQPNYGGLGSWTGGTVEHVQAVMECGVGLRVQVAVPVQGEAHRGMPSPSGDLLGVGPGRKHSTNQPGTRAGDARVGFDEAMQWGRGRRDGCFRWRISRSIASGESAWTCRGVAGGLLLAWW
jgi:hypothetical protein